MVLVVAGLVATSLAVFAFCGPVTRGADLNAWPESRIAYPGARLVATATKDKERPSWLDGNDYNAAELIKSYEVDISVPSGSIVTYYSRQLAALGWHDSTEVTMSAPGAGYCKPPNLAAFITFPTTQRYTYTLQDVSADVPCGSR
jgi:hypothetical protein